MYQQPISQPPQRVIVSSSGADREAAQAFKDMLGQWYRTLLASLEEGEDLLLEYHTPSGELINVNNVSYVRDTDMLIFQGHGADGNVCQMLVRAPSLHMMFRIVARADEEAERRPIGFDSVNRQGEQSEEE
jgi:hypothetical protein